MVDDDDALIFDAQGTPITMDVVLRAYEARCFPMADDRDGVINWYRPQERAVITWDRFHIPRSLRQQLRKQPFQLTIDKACADVIAACADRSETWISTDIERLYLQLHEAGYVHSVEAWDADHQLVGGLYGLAIGGCFCGESMFHTASNASKLCVVHLVEHLQACEFRMLDCQQQTEHMRRMGARLISDAEYADLLASCPEPRLFKNS